MSIDVDIGQITEALNDKADIGLGNTVDHLTTAAKEYFTGIGMPSHSYVELALGENNAEYTAPANGYFEINMTSDAAAQHINMINKLTGFSTEGVSAKSGNVVRQYLPVLKGDIITIGYATTTLNHFRFYYAEGVK